MVLVFAVTMSVCIYICRRRKRREGNRFCNETKRSKSKKQNEKGNGEVPRSQWKKAMGFWSLVL